MPGKSRHGKGRHSLQSKIRSQQPPMAAAAQPTTTPTAKPAAPAARAPAKGAAAPATTATIVYPYIGSELLRIGVLTGIVLVILIALAILYS